MSRGRSLAIAVGVALVLWGLAVASVPGFVGGVTLTTELLGAVAVVALAGGAVAIRSRLRAEETESDLPTPESAGEFSTPGEEFDEKVAALAPGRRMRGASERRTISDRLDALAVRVLVRQGASEQAAREQLAEGTWTDDPYAAAFFAEALASDIPLEERLRAAFSGEPSERRRARHAADALATIASREREQ
ncbi:DUF7269 family protein [Halococcus thailandensis]|uniref:Uncharacterized protein n=1 Tax=Halococcus thailandensis JCM 13552 TaxID=1227457 RepID=M0N8Z5_9EURY|nr:hypothetical protein [Halococcus thailandensis]EMA54023.1 hypothetical protein C451_07127 [Halococcus thailandensis JCM 13552]